MQIVQSGKPGVNSRVSSGLAAWLLTHFCGSPRVKFPRMGGARAERRMKLAETLSLGGKRQLMMVVCDGQRYLIGAGGDTVETIVAMTAEADRSEARPVSVKANGCGF